MSEKKTGAEPKHAHTAEHPVEHGPSTPDQATEAEKDATALPRTGQELPPAQEDEASDNDVERTTREMAAGGASAGEIAAYRADALAKLAED